MVCTFLSTTGTYWPGPDVSTTIPLEFRVVAITPTAPSSSVLIITQSKPLLEAVVRNEARPDSTHSVPLFFKCTHMDSPRGMNTLSRNEIFFTKKMWTVMICSTCVTRGARTLGLIVDESFTVFHLSDGMDGPKIASAFFTSVLVTEQLRIPESSMSTIAAEEV
jgi:hypothetical protein